MIYSAYWGFYTYSSHMLKSPKSKFYCLFDIWCYPFFSIALIPDPISSPSFAWPSCCPYHSYDFQIEPLTW